MAHWVRFEHDGETGIGMLEGETIVVCEGDLFAGATATGATVAVEDVILQTPCVPIKLIALWNNSRSAAEKQGLDQPVFPLFFIKPPNTYLPAGSVIRKPASYDALAL